MIHFLIGENSFERERFLKHATANFSGTVEKLQGSDVDTLRLSESLQAQSLFGDKRLVIVDELSSNKAVWEQLPDLLEQVSEDVTLILIEPKPDKRTRTYKDLLKRATVHDFAVWTAKNQRDAEQWLGKEAKEFGAKLTQVHIRHLIRRVGLDQWRLHHAVRKLALVDEVTEAIIDDVIEAHPDENIFLLFETALHGDSDEINSMIASLRQTDDAYKTMGLLSSQVMQYVALVYADKPSAEVAKDIGAHPFVLSKLMPLARRSSQVEARRLITIIAKTDQQIKSSGQDPWLLIERCLLEIGQK